MTSPDTDKPAHLPWFRRHPKKTLAAVFILGLLISDLLLTEVLAFTGIYETRSRTESRYRVRHPAYHHGLAPNMHASAIWGPLRYKVATNSMGFKDRETREVPLRSERRRILFIGDSFTEGVGLDYDRTCVGLVDRGLAKRGTEVLNAGSVSYCPLIYLHKVRYLLEDVGLEFDHVVVMLDVADIWDEVVRYKIGDDGKIHSKHDNKFSEDFKRFIGRHMLLCNGLRTAIRQVREGMQERVDGRKPERKNVRWTFDDKRFAEYGERGLKLADQSTSALWKVLQAREISMTLVVYPRIDHVQQGDLGARHVEHWRAWAATRKVAFVDLFPKFVGVGEPKEIIEAHFIPGDSHWNESGHALVGEALLNALTDG